MHHAHLTAGWRLGDSGNRDVKQRVMKAIQVNRRQSAVFAVKDGTLQRSVDGKMFTKHSASCVAVAVGHVIFRVAKSPICKFPATAAAA